MRNTTTKTTWRKTVAQLLVALLSCAVLAVSVATPDAMADRPVEFESTVVFPDTNPCTGSPMLVTLHLATREQTKDNGNVVVHVDRTGSTSDGYMLTHGVETFVFNGNVARGTFTDTLRNAQGSQFKAQGGFVATEDGPRVERFRLRCVTA